RSGPNWPAPPCSDRVGRPRSGTAAAAACSPWGRRPAPAGPPGPTDPPTPPPTRLPSVDRGEFRCRQGHSKASEGKIVRTPAPRALLYGDVDLNIIDGSAIWAQSMAQALAAAGCEVTVLLKAPVRTDRLTEPLTRTPGVRLLRPYEDKLLGDLGPRGLTPEQAVGLI